MNFNLSKRIAASLAVLVLASCGTNQASKEPVPPLHNDQPAPSKQPTEPVKPGQPTPSPTPVAQVPKSQTKFYRLMIKDDPATSIVIGYSLPATVDLPTVVYYDTSDHGTDIAKYDDQAAPTVKNQYKGLNNYFVELKRLKADTVYYFVVSDGKGVSARYSFRTTPDSSTAKLSVIAGGDSRSNQVPRQLANLLVPKLRPHFVMFAGDMTSSGTDAQWAEWFQDWQLTVARDGRMTAVLMTRGNHEASNEVVEKLFNTPAGVYYAVSFANDLLRVYTLNSEMQIAARLQGHCYR